MADPTTEQPKSFAEIASEQFPGSFFGEVLKKEPEPAVEAEEAETVEVEATSAEAEAEAVEEGTPPPDDEVEEVPISSISELAEHFELDPEWMDTLQTSVKINGQDGKASLAELRKSYQIQQAAEQRLEEAKARAKAETAAIAKKSEEAQNQLVTAAKLIEKAEGLFMKDYNAVEWDKLRHEDPAEYSAKQRDFELRKREIDGARTEALTEYQTHQSRLSEASKQQLAEEVARQHGMLVEKIPEWRDPDKAKAGKTELVSYLKDQGLSNEEIANAVDHRLIVMARKAMLFDRGQDKAELIEKKVKKIPKTLKPGTPKTPEQSKQIKKDELRAKLKRSGSDADALALLRAS